MPSRRLPHLYPQGRWIFLTWHLHGAIRPSECAPPNKVLTGEVFVLMDRRLDAARSGTKFLLQDAIASIVQSSLAKGEDLGHYALGPWVIMSNHVHALLLPKIPVSKLMRSLKGFTAHEANRILGRTGNFFGKKNRTITGFETKRNGTGLQAISRTILSKPD